MKEKKISKYIGKYVTIPEIFNSVFFLVCLFVFFSVTSASVKIASFVSARDAPIGLVTMLITLFSTLCNNFIKLFYEKSDEK